MDSKLKSWKPNEMTWLNSVKPRQKTAYPHEMKCEPVLNDLGEEIAQIPCPYDPTVPWDDDKNKVAQPYLSLDPANSDAFAAAAAVMESANDIKTSGLSPIGSDDADTMTIISNEIINSYKK